MVFKVEIKEFFQKFECQGKYCFKFNQIPI